MHNGRKLIDEWEERTQEERHEFLLELHKRYKFERLCSALLNHPDGILCGKKSGDLSMAGLIDDAKQVLYKIDILKRMSHEPAADG